MDGKGVTDAASMHEIKVIEIQVMWHTFPVARRALQVLVWLVLAWVVLAGSPTLASDVLLPRLYAVTTETGMPNLEENLRYTTTHEQRCLAQKDLPHAFPILTHAALKGCSLAKESRYGNTRSYVLICSGGHGTTGGATWQLEENRLRGSLNVKLGGKNMTFYQRLTATAVGACTASTSSHSKELKPLKALKPLAAVKTMCSTRALAMIGIGLWISSLTRRVPLPAPQRSANPNEFWGDRSKP